MRYAVIGYGRLGKACERLLTDQGKEVRVFSRRADADSLLPPLSLDKLAHYAPTAALLCVSSSQDAFSICPSVSALCPTVDCYDDHAQLSRYLAAMNERAAYQSVCAAGWDPGIFSVLRLLFTPLGLTHTFYGEGVSLGHSNAARTIDGVRDAVAYTLPVSGELAAAFAGGEVKPSCITHTRRVCVLPHDNADRGRIAHDILTHPYFSSYSCDVVFMEQAQFDKVRHDAFHQGRVITVGNGFSLNFTLSARSNAALTAAVMLSVLPVLPSLPVGAHLYAACLPTLFSTALI